jgi:signal peptidase I
MKGLIRLLLTLATLVLVLVTALPVSLGGSASYVSTTGISMQPRFHTGDLAILRSTPDYRVGDVAAYHSKILKTVVMHRIVGFKHGRYTFKGDNNSWLDPEAPTQDQLIGKLSVRIPHGGIWMKRMGNPLLMGLVAFGLIAAGGSAVHTRRQPRRRSGTVSQHSGRGRRRLWIGQLPSWANSVGAGILALGVLGLLLAVPAWSHPPTRSVTVDRASKQTMTFSYGTSVRRSAAYDSTTVRSPDPVFRRLAKSVDVHYSYRGDPGNITVLAKLSTDGGWHSTVPLGRRVAFESGTHTGTVRLDLDALEARAQAAAAATGIPAARVDVAIVPQVRTHQGAPFSPVLALVLTPLQLSLSDASADLVVRSSRVESTKALTGAELGFLGHQISVSMARLVSLVLLLGAMLGAAFLALFAWTGATTSEAARLRRRYASILIQVEPMPAPPGRPIVDVADFATLAKLAERYGLLVMHWQRSDVETYVVQDEGTTYRYRAGANGLASPRPEKGTFWAVGPGSRRGSQADASSGVTDQ